MYREKLFENIYFNYELDDKFKNNTLVVKFILPLCNNESHITSLIPYLLEMGNKKYKNIIELNKKLNSLYGANLFEKVEKLGGYQILSLGINFIDDRYSKGENIKKDCCELLLLVITDLYINNGLFYDRDIKISKNALLNKIDGRFSNKSIYALDKCEEIMFEGTHLSISKYGKKEKIKGLTKDDIKKSYYNILEKSRIEIIYIGSSGYKQIKEICENYLKNIKRNSNLKINFAPVELKVSVRNKEEKMEIEQSKLVMGFKLKKASLEPKQFIAIIVMNILYGSAPFSKLFVNIREKQGLCYSCFSKFDKFSYSMIVLMGIDSKNKEKAETEVLNQLEHIKNGDFELKDIENSKSILKNLLLKYKDETTDLINWNFKQIILGRDMVTLDDEIKLIDTISTQEIKNAADMFELDSIYFLKGDMNNIEN